jgi:multidrug efflux pump subunit AcrB
VDQVLRGANVSAPLGELIQDNRTRPLRLNGFLGMASEVGRIVVGVSRTGQPVYLKDIAVSRTGRRDRGSTRFAIRAGWGRRSRRRGPAVTLAIAKKGGTNAVVVATRSWPRWRS